MKITVLAFLLMLSAVSVSAAELGWKYQSLDADRSRYQFIQIKNLEFSLDVHQSRLRVVADINGKSFDKELKYKTDKVVSSDLVIVSAVLDEYEIYSHFVSTCEDSKVHALNLVVEASSGGGIKNVSIMETYRYIQDVCHPYLKAAYDIEFERVDPT